MAVKGLICLGTKFLTQEYTIILGRGFAGAIENVYT